MQSQVPVYGGFTVKGYLTREHVGATLAERHYAVAPDGRYFRSEATFRIGYPNFGNGEWIEITESEFKKDTREYIGEYAGVGISRRSIYDTTPIPPQVCAYPDGCFMPAAKGDIYCADCRSRVSID